MIDFTNERSGKTILSILAPPPVFTYIFTISSIFQHVLTYILGGVEINLFGN